MNECVAFELSSGLMWLIGLGLFWLGICFIAGMQTFGRQTLSALLEGVQKVLESYINKG